MNVTYTVWLSQISNIVGPWTGKPIGIAPDTASNYPCYNISVVSANWIIQRYVVATASTATNNQVQMTTNKNRTGSVNHTVLGSSVPVGTNGIYTDVIALSAEQLDDVFDSTELGSGGDWTPTASMAFITSAGISPNIETESVGIQAVFALNDNMSLSTGSGSCANSSTSSVTAGSIGTTPPTTTFPGGTGYITPSISSYLSGQASSGRNALYYTAAAIDYPYTPWYDEFGVLSGSLGPFSSYLTQDVNAVIPPFTFGTDGVTPVSPWTGIAGFSPTYDFYAEESGYTIGVAYDPYNSATAAFWEEQYINSCVPGYVDALPPKEVTIFGAFTNVSGVPLQRQQVELTYTTVRGSTVVQLTRTDCYGNFAFPPIYEAMSSIEVAPLPTSEIQSGCMVVQTPSPITGKVGVLHPARIVDSSALLPAPVMPGIVQISLTLQHYNVKVAWVFTQPGTGAYYLITNQSGTFASFCTPAIEKVMSELDWLWCAKNDGPERDRVGQLQWLYPCAGRLLESGTADSARVQSIRCIGMDTRGSVP